MRKRLNYEKRSPYLIIAIDYGLLILGSLITALAFNSFLGPNQIASGGVAGTSIIVNHIWGIQLLFRCT
jgi:uncharacterized membrane-anchored protein YitT (DUF2179 family)